MGQTQNWERLYDDLCFEFPLFVICISRTSTLNLSGILWPMGELLKAIVSISLFALKESLSRSGLSCSRRPLSLSLHGQLGGSDAAAAKERC